VGASFSGRKERHTYANATPATTGSNVRNCVRLLRVLGMLVEKTMVIKGVDVRTTWWNWGQKARRGEGLAAVQVRKGRSGGADEDGRASGAAKRM